MQNAILNHNAGMIVRVHKKLRRAECELMFAHSARRRERLKIMVSELRKQLKGYANASVGARAEMDSESR